MLDRGEKVEAIAKTNKFLSLTAGNLIFLDILNFLRGASSLNSFLKAFKCSELKGYFPYEYMTCPERLQETSLPPFDSFFSKLKNVNVLSEEYAIFERIYNQTGSEAAALKKLGVNSKPSTGEENYRYLQQLWIERGMKSMKDFLEWYNNKDVLPTIEALEKMRLFYAGQRIDMYKQGLTLPGLANVMLHRSTGDVKFHLFSEGDKHLDALLRNSMVGGPSIIFNRFSHVGETNIKRQ